MSDHREPGSDEKELNQREAEIIERFRQRQADKSAKAQQTQGVSLDGDILAPLNVEHNDKKYAGKPMLHVVQWVYHQTPGEQPESTESRYSRQLEQDEQTYKRRTTLNEQWTPVDTGWLKKVGMLVVINEEGNRFRNNPSAGELKEVEKRVIEVAIMPTLKGRRDMHSPPNEPIVFAKIPPGEDIRLTPENLSQYVIRSRTDTTRCTIVAIPS